MAPLDIKPDTSTSENDDAPKVAPPEPLNFHSEFGADAVPETPAQGVSPLGDLKAKRAEFMGKMHKDIHVPRWNPQNGLPYLYVRIRPISQTELFDTINKRQDEYNKQVANNEVPQKDSGMKANADLVALATKGIYLVNDDQDPTRYAVTGSTDESKWTKFDGATGPITADNLGIALDPRDPIATLVRGVFNDSDGDLLWFTNRLLEFSNLSNSEADTAF